jgi:hypothetical protein
MCSCSLYFNLLVIECPAGIVLIQTLEFLLLKLLNSVKLLFLIGDRKIISDDRLKFEIQKLAETD